MELKNEKMLRKDNINLNEQLIKKMNENKKYYQLENFKCKNYFTNSKNKLIGRINFGNYIIISFILILINIYTPTLTNGRIKKANFNLSNITLKIKGLGDRKILTSETRWFTTSNYPNKIIINGEIQETVKYEYNFQKEENYVKLIWEDNNINNCDCMFKDCIDITEINFTNFDTSNVSKMNSMFYGCKSLTSLDLSSFNTHKLKRMQRMFEGCEKLEYINMINFDESTLIDSYEEYKMIFDNIPDTLVICINENITKNRILPQLKSKCYNIDCSEDWKSKQKKIIYNISACECQLDNCLSCPSIELQNKKLCTTECNQGFYRMENDPSSIDNYFYCYKEPKGYYLDETEFIYKKCYETCETCEFKGDSKFHNCLECNNNYQFTIKKNNYFNCYETCKFYYYFDSDNNYQCTYNENCPEEYPILIQDKRECISDNKYISSQIIVNEYTISILNIKTEKMQYIKNIDIENIIQSLIKSDKNEIIEKEEEIKAYDKIIENIENIFINNYDTTNLDKGEEQIINAGKMTITLTTTNNQKNNKTYNNMTIIDLGECENLLRKFYNISNIEILYMKKIDIKQENIKIPKVEYNVYRKISDINLEKLNLSICNESKISILVPIKITENLDKLNSSSDYFNNICYKSKSDKGTDIILKDRQKEFVEGDKTVCQEKCDFSDYNTDTQRANCSCDAKDSSQSFVDMNINKESLYENFEDKNSKSEISNLGITSCNVLASKENIESNTGFFSLLVILAVFIIIFIIFCTKGYNLLENKIDEVIHKKFNNKTKIKTNKIIKSVIKRTENIGRSKNQKIKMQGKIKSKPFSSGKILTNKNTIKNISKKKTSSILQKVVNNQNTQFSNIKPDTDYEINWLSYEEALKYDKRNNCEYYCSLIKSKQLFIFTFCSFNDYNSGIIKKFMLFLSFALHYTLNALFFNEETLHQIYEDEGKFNFQYQISHILISAAISTFILRLILQTLVLTDKDILQVKLQLTKILAINMKKAKLKYMKIKFAIFFILNFILLGLFWYYLTCFNAIYQNTQVYLIENTFISFGFSLFYPFIINILPMIIRMCSIHSSNKNQKCLYKLSQLIQLI